MKDKLESRVMRIVISGLLKSDLTMSELKKVSEMLMSSPSLTWDIADLLKSVSMARSAAYDYSPAPSGGLDFDEIATLVRNKKISRRRLWEAINSVNPKIANEIGDDAPSIHILLSEFFERSTRDDWSELRSRLNGKNTADPYLEGISKERK